MTKRIYKGPPASDSFKGAVSGGGQTEIDCGYCGRTHIAIDSHNLTMDEAAENYRESLLEQAKDAPDDYVLVYDCDFVHYADMNGIVIPDDCPCNGLAQYEHFMWNMRDTWKKYLMLRKLRNQKENEDIGDIEGY